MYQCILTDFSHKAYSKVDFGCVKISDAIFSGQSLLLSTTMLNDNFHNFSGIVLVLVLRKIKEKFSIKPT